MEMEPMKEYLASVMTGALLSDKEFMHAYRSCSVGDIKNVMRKLVENLDTELAAVQRG
jgi:hypothetical protein